MNATTTLPTPPERIHGWPACSATARHFGRMTVQGHHYTIAYDEPGQPLVREDVLAAEAKAAKQEKKHQRDEAQQQLADAQELAAKAGLAHRMAVQRCVHAAVAEAVAAEREACAKACESSANRFGEETLWAAGYVQGILDVASGIRARGAP